MTEPTHIPCVTDGTLGELLAAACAALILTRLDCGACAAYEADVLARRAGGQLGGVAVGKLVLDAAGAPRFKRDNVWLAGVSTLPYTVLYVHGRQVDGFATSKSAYLLERLADVRPLTGGASTA